MATPQFTRFAEHVASYGLDIQCAMDGDDDAEIVIVSEYPGEQEVAYNKPFMGAAGKHLWNALRRFNILRTQCYVTNVIKRRVTTNTPVNQVEFTLWKEALEYELSHLHNCKLIIALGNSAIAALLGTEGVSTLRGSVYSYGDIPVLVANNPAMILRDPSQEIIFLMDMHKANRVLQGDFHVPKITEILYPSFSDALDYLERCHQHKTISVDIEVIGMETACIGIAYKEDEAMCIAFRDKGTNVYTPEEEFLILRKFLEVTDDKSVEVITQNGNFDSYFMGYKDHAQFRISFDTLLAHHTLYPSLPHNLGFLTSQYTDHPYYKDEKDVFKEGGDIEGFWRYNCKDAAITLAIANKLREELRQQNLLDFFTSHVMRLQPHLVTSTVTGIKTDLTAKQRLHQELSKDVTALYDKFQAAVAVATGDHELIINPNSPKQLKELFYQKLGCSSPSKSTAEPVRENWLKDPRVSENVKNVIIALNNYAREHKFFSTYVETKIDPDGRFRAEYKQYGTTSAPGRLSSGQTLWGSGGNAQNQPRRAREMYLADDNCVFWYFDLAQAEARYVGWDAWIEKWVEDFEKARLDGEFDAHRSLASTMFNVPYDEVPKKDEINGEFTIRYIAKRCRHGLNYRMQIARLAQTTGLSLGNAAKNYYAYHRVNPELKVWWEKLEREARTKKQLFNSLGRRLQFLNRLDDEEALKSVVAFRPQSTIGDKVSQVWYETEEDPRWDMRYGRVVANVHDALWGVATPGFAHKALSIAKAYAEKPIMVTSIVTGKTNPMIIPADLKISDPEKEIRNMENMVSIKLEAARI